MREDVQISVVIVDVPCVLDIEMIIVKCELGARGGDEVGKYSTKNIVDGER